MDGAAIRIAVSAVFAANLVGDPLSLSEMLMVVLVGTLASIGTAGVPGAGIVMIATVFVQLGLPMEAVALLTAIDALVGMGCTALNVTSDLVGSTVIDKNEKNEKLHNAKKGCPSGSLFVLSQLFRQFELTFQHRIHRQIYKFTFNNHMLPRDAFAYHAQFFCQSLRLLISNIIGASTLFNSMSWKPNESKAIAASAISPHPQ